MEEGKGGICNAMRRRGYRYGYKHRIKGHGIASHRTEPRHGLVNGEEGVHEEEDGLDKKDDKQKNMGFDSSARRRQLTGAQMFSHNDPSRRKRVSP